MTRRPGASGRDWLPFSALDDVTLQRTNWGGQRLSAWWRRPAYRLAEASKGAQANQTPFDVDELAFAAGRLSFLGIWASRVVMTVGAFFASLAAKDAARAIAGDLAAWRGHRGCVQKIAAEVRQSCEEARACPNEQALLRIVERRGHWGAKMAGLATHLFLFLGASGMALNLVCAKPMMGGWFPALAHFAARSVSFAVAAIALWGASLAVQAMSLIYVAHRRARWVRALPKPTQRLAAYEAIATRSAQAPRRDACVALFALGLGASALGLQPQASLWPLATLAFSTVGLVFSRIRRGALGEPEIGHWPHSVTGLPETLTGLEQALGVAWAQHLACTRERPTRFRTFGLQSFMLRRRERKLGPSYASDAWARAYAHLAQATPHLAEPSLDARDRMAAVLMAARALFCLEQLACTLANDAAFAGCLTERDVGGRRHALFRSHHLLTWWSGLPPPEQADRVRRLEAHGLKLLWNEGALQTSRRVAWTADILLERRLGSRHPELLARQASGRKGDLEVGDDAISSARAQFAPKRTSKAPRGADRPLEETQRSMH